MPLVLNDVIYNILNLADGLSTRTQATGELKSLLLLPKPLLQRALFLLCVFFARKQRLLHQVFDLTISAPEFLGGPGL